MQSAVGKRKRMSVGKKRDLIFYIALIRRQLVLCRVRQFQGSV